jgi:hypothetical protein
MSTNGSSATGAKMTRCSSDARWAAGKDCRAAASVPTSFSSLRSNKAESSEELLSGISCPCAMPGLVCLRVDARRDAPSSALNEALCRGSGLWSYLIRVCRVRGPSRCLLSDL